MSFVGYKLLLTDSTLWQHWMGPVLQLPVGVATARVDSAMSAYNGEKKMRVILM